MGISSFSLSCRPFNHPLHIRPSSLCLSYYCVVHRPWSINSTSPPPPTTLWAPSRPYPLLFPAPWGTGAARVVQGVHQAVGHLLPQRRRLFDVHEPEPPEEPVLLLLLRPAVLPVPVLLLLPLLL